MQRTILAGIFICVFAGVLAAQGTCVRHREATGGFSYCPPVGWVPRDSSSGGPYKSFFAPEGSAINANLNMKSEPTTMNHDSYVAASVRHLLEGNEERGPEARKMIGWTKFVTNTNLPGSRMVYETSYKGLALRTVQFILDLPGKKLVLTGTTLVTHKETTDKLFDEVAKSISVLSN